MRLILAAALALLTTAAFAQDAPPPAAPVTVSPAEGNWGCIALVDNT